MQHPTEKIQYRALQADKFSFDQILVLFQMTLVICV